MKSHKLIIILAVFVVLSLLASHYRSVFPRPIQLAQNAISEPQIDVIQGTGSSESPKSRIIYKLIKERDNSKPNLRIEYPQVDNPQKQEDLVSINEAIKKDVYGIVNENAPEFGYIKSRGLPKGSWFEITYTPTRSDDLIISIKFNISAYGEGAAHPNRYTSVFNYSVGQDRKLEFRDIFQPGSDYLTRLSELSYPLVREALAQKGYEDDGGDKSTARLGTSPGERNFQNILLGDNQIIVIFDPYQVGPYAAGQIEISIPSQELRSVLNSWTD